MERQNDVFAAIERGRQVGCRSVLELENDSLYCSFAVQKYNDEYLLYYDEVLESNMVAEVYEAILQGSFRTIVNLNKFIANNDLSDIQTLRPIKGQKIFDAANLSL